MKAVKRQLAVGLAGVLGILVVAALVVPLFVDVDRYRPQLLAAVNERISGKLHLGKLSLSLWGRARVGIAELELTDVKGEKILAVKDASLQIPLFSLLRGAPDVTLALNRPEIRLVKNASGQLNFLSLLPQQSSGTSNSTGLGAGTASPHSGAGAGGTTAGAGTASAGASSGAAASGNMPGALLGGGRLGFSCSQAHLVYLDQKTGAQSEVSDVQITLKDISAVQPSLLEVSAQVDSRLGSDITIKGPIHFQAQLTPASKNPGSLEGLTVGVVADADLKALEVSAGGGFQKTSKDPLGLQVKLKGSSTRIEIESVLLRLFSAELSGKGEVLLGEASPRFSLQFQTPAIALAPWSGVLPALKPFDLSGALQLQGTAQGTVAQPRLEAELELQRVGFQAPGLKAKTQVQAKLKVTQDSMESLLVDLQSAGVDLKLQGKVMSFLHPKAQFQLSSQSLDLDRWIAFPAPTSSASQSAKVDSGQSSSTPGPAARGAGDPDELLAPLRNHPLARSSAVTFKVDLKKVLAKGMEVQNFSCQLDLKDLLAEIKPCRLEVFSGGVQTSLQLNLKPLAPTYGMELDVSHLDLSSAAASQVPWAKNTLKGLADFRMKAQGVSFHPDKAQKALRASGSFQVAQASFHSIDIMKMLKEVVRDTLSNVAEKVPALKGKSLDRIPDITAQYQTVSSDFAIGDQKFSAPHFVAIAVPQKGVDLKGTTLLGLKDGSLETHWEVTDTHNLTHLKDVSIDVQGVNVPHLLAEGNQPVKFSVHVGCQLTAPCYSYKEVPEAFAKIALKNMSQAAKGKLESTLKEKGGEALKKALPRDLGNKLKGLFH
jgi:hypothetical protein